MAPRKRLLVAIAAVAVLVTAVLGLRASWQTGDTRPPVNTSENAPPRVDRFTKGGVTALRSEERPAVPSALRIVAGRGNLRVDWADAHAAGYEVRWHRAGEAEHTELIVPPEVQLDGLTDGATYTVDVRSVDAYGIRSATATVSGTPGDQPGQTWKSALTGLFDDFTDDTSVRADVPGSRWHLSGYGGCVDAGAHQGQLTISLACGTDQAVLRARSPMRLHDPTGADGELGRVAVVTDAAGPGGQLTIGLVPGPADRLGTKAETLPAGALQVVIDDHGVQVQNASTSPPGARRGVGVLHRFEVVLTTSGVRVLQDGVLIGTAGVVPAWRDASVLLGFSGPVGRKSLVHVDAAGFAGPATQAPAVVEVPIVAATHQVLAQGTTAPNIGTSRQPLIGASSARVVCTVVSTGALDPANLVVQLGDRLFPATPTVPGALPGGATSTVYADLPADLFGAQGPDQLSPFVLRTAKGTADATVVESYLEIRSTKSPTSAARNAPAPQPSASALPGVTVVLNDASGKPVDMHAVPADSRLVIALSLDGAAQQWDSGSLAGVQGIQLWLDGHLELGEPTNVDGPGVGGQYTLLVDSSVLSRGAHVLEVREYGTAAAPPPVSVLTDFTVS